MGIGQPSRLFAGGCAVLIALILASATGSASAAPSRGRVALAPLATQSAAVPVRCKTRNKASGTLKYSDWQFPESLSPTQASSVVSQETIASIYDELTGYDNHGRVFPLLLDRIPSLQNGMIRDGGKTIIATLKHGTRWSDGSEITAADINFGWRIAMDKNSGGACSGTCDIISRIEIQGKYKVTFHLAGIYAAFIPGGFPPVWPVAWKGAWKKDDARAAAIKLYQTPSFNFEGPSYPTNGPFQVAQFIKDDRIVLHPMNYYTTMSCGARVATLIFAFYSSKPGMIAAAASHETDATTNYTLADLSALRRNSSSYILQDQPAYDYETAVFNVDAKYGGRTNPLHKTAVRQALALALDRLGLIQSSLGMGRKQALGVLAWTPLVLTNKLVQPFAERSLKGQWDPIARKYQADTGHGQALSDAIKLLQRAGYAQGFSLTGVTTDGNPERVSEFSVMQKSWHDIGVDLQPNYLPASRVFGTWKEGGTLPHGQFQVALFGDAGQRDPDPFKYEFQHQYIDRKSKNHGDQNQNFAGINDKVFDVAFDRAAGSFDPKVRQKWYSVWQVRLNQAAYVIPLFYRSSIATVDANVGNFKPNPAPSTDEWNTWQWFVRGRR